MPTIKGGFSSKNPFDIAKIAGMIFKPATKEELATAKTSVAATAAPDEEKKTAPKPAKKKLF